MAAVPASIDRLPPEILKPILGLLDCQQLLRARQVCWLWHGTVAEIIEDATLRGTPITHTETCDTFGEGSEPTSNVHLQLMVLHDPKMTVLDVPEQQEPLLDLAIVANTCKSLKAVDLRGFSVTQQSFGTLISHNSQLRSVTLPAGCNEALLEELRHATSLWHLTVVAPAGTGRWLRSLPSTLKYLTIIDCPGVTASGPLHLGRLTKLHELTLHGGLPGVITDTEDTGRWLQELPPTLQYLKISDCPGVTASGLLNISRLTNLRHLTLHGLTAGVITDAVLDGLHGCTGLWRLQLGDLQGPPETTITAAAVSRLAVACRELEGLYLHTTAANSQALVDALGNAHLGSVIDSDNDNYSDDGYCLYGGYRRRLRWLSLHVPGSVFSQLRDPPSDSRIEVTVWWHWRIQN